MSLMKFNKMRAIANPYGIHLPNLKILQHLYKGVDVSEVVTLIDVEKIKQQYGVELRPKIEGTDGVTSVLYLENLDELYDKDQAKFKDIIRIIGEFVPSIDDDGEVDLSNLESDDEGEFDADAELESILGSDAKKSESKDVSDDDEIEEKKIEKIPEKAAEIPSKADVQKIIQSDLDTNEMCNITKILKKYPPKIHPQIVNIVKSICKERGWEYDEGGKMIYLPIQ